MPGRRSSRSRARRSRTRSPRTTSSSPQRRRATSPASTRCASACGSISPAAPTTAFTLGEKLDDPLAMYVNDITTIPANLAGIPGMGLPMGLGDDGMPVGLQILAPMFEDERLYRAGAAIEALLADRWGGILT